MINKKDQPKVYSRLGSRKNLLAYSDFKSGNQLIDLSTIEFSVVNVKIDNCNWIKEGF